MKILIVKTSSIGDIIQAFPVLDYLHSKFNNVEIDWVAEEANISLINLHPLINSGICFDLKNWKKNLITKSAWKSFFSFMKNLRKKRYDLLFDLQGNFKSALVTYLAKAKVKIGFGFNSVREWPNLLATNKHFDVDSNINMRFQYLQLLTKYFSDNRPFEIKNCDLIISEDQKKYLDKLLAHKNLHSKTKVMVCPFTKWSNKQLSNETMISFLKLTKSNLNASFLFIWGNEEEKRIVKKLQNEFEESSIIVDKLSFSAWQNLMDRIDLVIAMDSSSLHLSGTTRACSFSIFGPTKAEIFKPIGEKHHSFQGQCPYNKAFKKLCPLLRSCETGACIKELKAEDLFNNFISWWK